MLYVPWTPVFSLLSSPSWPTDWMFSLTAVFVLLAIPTISLGGAIVLLTLPMKDNQKGILAFFVTVSSFVPVVFLGFEVLYWVLRVWQLATIALIWSILLLMVARILNRRRGSSADAGQSSTLIRDFLTQFSVPRRAFLSLSAMTYTSKRRTIILMPIMPAATTKRGKEKGAA